MCGIVGIFGPQASKVNLNKSVDQLLDRGPDSHSIASPNAFLSLGAARLAMTDPLPRSNQPFEKNGNWIVFNGEIYNHNELKEWLRNSHGIIFTTNSDTEVLLEILRVYGSEGVRYLNGMYAFAYFDKVQQKVVLGRDRLGKKPLFYAVDDKNIFWASTLTALRKIFPSNQIDKDALVSYLAFGYTIDPSTMYENIKAVTPGYCYEIKTENHVETQKSPVFESRFDSNYTVSTLFEEIKSSVSDRIDGHNGVAISLSGGLDSSIVALLSAQSNHEVVAYSLRWTDSDKGRYNTDFERAEVIAANLNLKFVGVDFLSSNGYLEASLKDFVRFMGEPNSNPTGVSLVPLYRRISQDGFRLVLTGDGADEIFGGYPRYESPLLGNGFRFLNDEQIISLLNVNSKLAKMGLRLANYSSPGLWANFHWSFKPKDISLLLNLDSATHSRDITKELFSLIANLDFNHLNCDSNSALKTVMQRDSSIWLTNESNRKLDRISMAFSIEARSPFQDERVIKNSNRVMQQSGFQSHEKKSLREMFPELSKFGVRDDKAGFISPVGHWLRTNPQLVNTGLDAVMNSGFFNRDEVFRRRRDQFSGDFERIRQLWSLVVLGYWFLDSWEK